MSQLEATHDAYNNPKSVKDATLGLIVRMAGENSALLHSGNTKMRELNYNTYSGVRTGLNWFKIDSNNGAFSQYR
jgi:hypothetical protein